LPSCIIIGLDFGLMRLINQANIGPVQGEVKMSKFHRNKKKKPQNNKDKRLIIILVISAVFAIGFLASIS
jgi:hypothetical protein